MDGHPGWIQKTLSEDMWVLSVPSGLKSVKPWVQKNCAFLFSSKESVVRFGKNVKVSKDKGLFNIKGWDALLEVLKGVKADGCTHVAIDPERETTVPQRIDEVIGAAQDVIDGQRGFGLHPN